VTIEISLTFCERCHKKEIVKLFWDINEVLTSQNDTLVQMLIILVKTSKKVNITYMIIHYYCSRLWLQTLLCNGQEYTYCLLEVMDKHHDLQPPVIGRQGYCSLKIHRPIFLSVAH